MEELGRAEVADATRSTAWIAKLGNPALIMSLIHKLSGSADAPHRTHVEAKLSANIDLLAFAGQAMELIGDTAEAERIYRAGARAHPRSAEMLMRFGRLLLRAKKPSARPRCSKRRWRWTRTMSIFSKMLVAAHRELEQREREEESARRVVALVPIDGAEQLDLATEVRRSGRREEALEHAKRAAALEPGNERYARYVAELSKARRAR